MNPEIGGNLLERHTVIAITGDPHNVVTELTGIRPSHSDILPAAHQGQAISGVTYSCSRPSYNGWTSSAGHDKRGRPVHYPTADREADLCPVVWINLPAGAKIKDFDVKILEFFGLPGEGRINSLTNRAVGAAERHQTQLLIVDITDRN